MLGEHGRRRCDEQRGIAREVEPHAQRLILRSRRRCVRSAVLHVSVDRFDTLDTGQRGQRLDDRSVGGLVRGKLERPLSFQLADEGLRRVEGEHPAVIHDRDPVGEERRLVHVVRREDQRDLRVAQLPQPVPDEEPRSRVKARRRLVEEEHPRRVHERAGNHHPLRLAAGEEVRLVSRAVEQAELVEHLVRAALTLAGGHAVVGGVEDEVVADRDRAVEVAALRNDGDLLPRAHGIPDDVDASDERSAAGRPYTRRQHPDRRRLPRAVRAEQPEHLAGRDRERNAVDGVHGRLRISLDEIEHLDSGHGSVLGEHHEIVGPALVDARRQAEPRPNHAPL